MDILDILLDEENSDPIILYNDNNEAVKFEQIAIIPHNDELYAILRPNLPSIKEDEAFVFLVDVNEEGNSTLVPVIDMNIIDIIFKKFYELIEEDN